MKKADLAVIGHDQGFNCAQAVLAAYVDDFGLEAETALRVAGAFGGGITRSGATCGAVTGALMVLGLRYAMVRPGDLAAKEQCYAVGRDFMERFRRAQGALDCHDLLGQDLNTPEGRQAVRDQGLTDKVCNKCIRMAVALVDDILARDGPPDPETAVD